MEAESSTFKFFADKFQIFDHECYNMLVKIHYEEEEDI